MLCVYCHDDSLDETGAFGFSRLGPVRRQFIAQKLFLPGGITGTNPVYEFDAGRFAAWCAGETRWPLINACMKQLERTGYLSNRARQIAASVLINELELDWRAGAAWFERQLIDHDVATNWGNWQYIAGVGADPRGGRHFSIEKQARLVGCVCLQASGGGKLRSDSRTAGSHDAAIRRAVKGRGSEVLQAEAA